MKNQSNAPGARPASRAFAQGLLLAAAGVCTSALAGEPAARLAAKPAAPSTAKALVAAWTAKAGTADTFVTALAATADTVVAAGDDGALTAWNAANGKVRWIRQPTAGVGGEVVGLSAEGDRIVVAWSNDAQLQAFDALSGKPVWQTLLPDMPRSMLACRAHRANVTVTVSDGALVAFAHDAADGKPLWRVPVGGQLVGAGGDHVFLGVRSSTGRLNARIEALHCGTGERTTLPAGGRAFGQFLAAADGRVVLRHFELGFSNERVCVVDLGGEAAPECFEPKIGEHADSVSGALLHGGKLHLTANHMYAHNLDPRPDGWIATYAVPGLSPGWTSAPMRSSGDPVWAGGQIVSGFGSTGVADFVHLTDPADGSHLGALPVKKAPEIIILAGSRGATSLYGGTVVGFDLPRPVEAPAPRAAVTPQPDTLKVAAPTGQADLGWTTLGTWKVHPERATTSGVPMPGYASPAVFLDAAGTRLAVGGNDDKVRVVDVQSGKALWTSKPLGKDVEAIHPCQGGRFVARVYGGKAFAFEPAGKGYRPSKALGGPMGWTSGVTDDCAHYLADDFDGAYHLRATATDTAAGTFMAPGTFDHRGTQVRGNLLVVGEADRLRVLDLSDLARGYAERGTVPTANPAHGGNLTQAWMVNPQLLVREYCAAASCTVELVNFPEGDVKHTLRFDTQAAGWSPTVPSALDVDAAGTTLFFFRRDLPPVLIEVASGKSQPVSGIVGQPPTELTEATFSADGKRLALAMYPAPWQITVLSR